MNCMPFTRRKPARAVLTVLLFIALSAARATMAQSRHVPDTFTATTTAMTPAGLKLKIQVQEWSDDRARAAVIAALKDAVPAAKALATLPTVGYIWGSNCSVGYAVKYAYREATADNGERITIVTNKPLDSYSSQPWKVSNTSAKKRYDYSVIELRIGGHGHGAGTTSLAADVELDDRTHTVSLDHAATTTNVLTAVRREPKPYWAR